MCDVSNDISLSGGYASTAAAQSAMLTLYAATFLPYLTVGYTAVVCSTVISRGDFPFQFGFGNFMEDARQFWNALLRGVAAAQGFILSDRAANPPFSLSTGYTDAVNYATDHVHPTDAGNIIIAAIDLAAILSA